ncbi:MAG TPA: pyruvoyl-dependent arginine decarboxylase [Phycisphaerae bacterium]|nr:pyruvoyl-dependent arginine decarboxylase [Phycisphaerae bacterium]
MTQEWITPIPSAVFFTKGVGKHKYRPQSLELAMRHAGIEKYNLVQVSGILPGQCKIITVQQGIHRLTPGQVVFGNMSESSTDEPNRLLCAGLGVAMPVKDQYGYISEHHGYGMTEERIGDFVEDMAATMLATTLGIEFDPAKNYDERKEIYRMSGNIVRTRNIVQTAEGDKNGLWTTVIAAAVFII